MTAVLAQKAPQRLRSAILGGIGIGLIEGGGPGENVAAALEAPSLEDVTDPVGRTFRAFADQTRSDRRAPAGRPRGGGARRGGTSPAGSGGLLARLRPRPVRTGGRWRPACAARGV